MSAAFDRGGGGPARPNGKRATLDRYFTAEALAPYEPTFRAIARDLVASVEAGRVVDAVSELGAPFAVRAQSAWLGWPSGAGRSPG